MMTPTSKPHHHGDLKNALVAAGIALLAEGGRSNLTLRKVAARAQVSHAAPAHHFDGLDELLRAIAAEGFKTFSNLMIEERDKADADPHAQLMGITLGYLRFAAEHDALFDLIFSEPMKNGGYAPLVEQSEYAFAILSDTCALFEPDPGGPMVNEIRGWSTVHGYAILRKFDRLRPYPDGPTIPPDLIMPRLNPKR